jgi:hypothetical protein
MVLPPPPVYSAFTSRTSAVVNAMEKDHSLSAPSHSLSMGSSDSQSAGSSLSSASSHSHSQDEKTQEGLGERNSDHARTHTHMREKARELRYVLHWKRYLSQEKRQHRLCVSV